LRRQASRAGCHCPRWLPLAALAATGRAGCHWPRWLPLAALAATGRAGCHWLWQADRL
ncbi:unnamed protein product, partial [Gadus morhua 'NCC']